MKYFENPLDQVYSEYVGVKAEIENIRKEIACNEARLIAYQNMESILYDILTNYGEIKYQHYEQNQVSVDQNMQRLEKESEEKE